jgi:hypothetical protein
LGPREALYPLASAVPHAIFIPALSAPVVIGIRVESSSAAVEFKESFLKATVSELIDYAGSQTVAVNYRCIWLVAFDQSNDP